MERIEKMLLLQQQIAGAPDAESVAARLAQGAAGLLGGRAGALICQGPSLVMALSQSGPPQAARAAPSGPVGEPAEMEAVLRKALGASEQETLLAAPVEAEGRLLGLLAVAAADPEGEPPARIVLSALAGPAASALMTADRIRRAEEAAAVAAGAEAQFRNLLEAAPDPIVIVDERSRIILVNAEAERSFGYAHGELLGADLHLLIPQRLRDLHRAHHTLYFQQPSLRPMGTGLELTGARKDGSEFPVEVSLSPLVTPAGVLVTAMVRDVTERQRSERERARLLESERHKSAQLTLAVREAHHRIKNNLQAVTDLLSLELALNPVAAQTEVLHDSIERIQAIALVHDLLSHDDDVETVDSRELIHRLVPQVLRSSGLDPSELEISITADSVLVPSKTATTLALVLNELVSNASKHAFSPRRGGTLQVRFQPEGGELLLEVRDDGPGLPDDFDAGRDGSVGMQVITALVRSDLHGRLTLTSQRGLRAAVLFPA